MTTITEQNPLDTPAVQTEYNAWLDGLQKDLDVIDVAEAAEQAKRDAAAADAVRKETARFRAAMMALGFDPGELEAPEWTAPDGVRFYLTHRGASWLSACMSSPGPDDDDGYDSVYCYRGLPNPLATNADRSGQRGTTLALVRDLKAEFEVELKDREARRAKDAAKKTAQPELPPVNRYFLEAAEVLEDIAKRVRAGLPIDYPEAAILASAGAQLQNN